MSLIFTIGLVFLCLQAVSIIKFSFKMNLISTIYKINLNRMRQYKNYITVFNKNIFNNY